MPSGDLIAIRHGKTKYTNEGLDLTEDGISETKKLARVIGPDLRKYDEIIVISSPLARTKGTAKVFLDELGIQCEPRIMDAIRCVDIRDVSAFNSFEKQNSTDIYGEMWFTHPDLADDNDFCEGRDSVNNRANIFLRQITRFLRRRAIETGKDICIIAFTHFEIATNYLKPLYPDEHVPSSNAAGLRNSEAIVIGISTEEAGKVTIKARGLEAKVRIQNNGLNLIEEP